MQITDFIKIQAINIKRIWKVYVAITFATDGKVRYDARLAANKIV